MSRTAATAMIQRAARPRAALLLLARAGAFVAALVLAQGAAAASPAEIDRLARALKLPEIVEVMVEEGHAYGESLGQDMLSDGGDATWKSLVQRIYDPAKMLGSARPVFDRLLAETEITPLIAYFESDLGRRIVDHEIRARVLFLDDTAEQAARELYRDLAPDDRRLRLVQEYMAVNELVDYNVTGAMNANYMFFRGLAEGGAYEADEDEMLSEVWAQAEETRADSEEWLSAYLLTAYADMPDSAVESYTELSRTPAGRQLNAALFEAFDKMYRDISYALGLAVAAQLSGQDI